MQDRDLDELQRIWELREKGAISEEEYLGLKARILRQGTPPEGAQKPTPALHLPPIHPDAPRGRDYRKSVGIGCAVVLVLIVIGIVAAPSGTQNNSATDSNSATNIETAGSNDSAGADSLADSTAWSYSEDEDKVRGGTTYYARTTSTNSIAQDFPYDSDTTMTMTVRKSPASGTDVLLTISSGQMMCPSYEGCSGTVRFDNGPAQRLSFSGPADNDSETVFVDGAKAFIAKLKRAKKVMIEKTLYQAGNPQFEFDVHGLKWDH